MTALSRSLVAISSGRLALVALVYKIAATIYLMLDNRSYPVDQNLKPTPAPPRRRPPRVSSSDSPRLRLLKPEPDGFCFPREAGRWWRVSSAAVTGAGPARFQIAPRRLRCRCCCRRVWCFTDCATRTCSPYWGWPLRTLADSVGSCPRRPKVAGLSLQTAGRGDFFTAFWSDF